MAKAKRYSMEQVEAARKLLRTLAATKSGKTKKEVVELLAEDMRKAVKEGHSLKAVQEALGKSAIPVSLARMKALAEEKSEISSQNGHSVSAPKGKLPSHKKQPATSKGDNSKDVSVGPGM